MRSCLKENRVEDEATNKPLRAWRGNEAVGQPVTAHFKRSAYEQA